MLQYMVSTDFAGNVTQYLCSSIAFTHLLSIFYTLNTRFSMVEVELECFG